MNLQNRVQLLLQLKEYLLHNTVEWQEVKQEAERQNGWFIREFTEVAVSNILTEFLDENRLKAWADYYHLDDNIGGRNIGIVMAGNIPLVGFHDFLCVFMSGHNSIVKLSSKDNILLQHFIEKMSAWEPSISKRIKIAEMLKGCDAYIATGSNNSAIYFEKYFGKYAHIIRHNKTSVGLLTGNETREELERFSDDVHLFFGLGCRNVTKIYVPENYDFVPLLRAFDKHHYFKDHNKFRNNYDYQLSLVLLNNIYYMANDCTLLLENKAIFSPISQLNYEFIKPDFSATGLIKENPDIQCIVGHGHIAFGEAQKPGLFDYADGIDTMQFLLSL